MNVKILVLCTGNSCRSQMAEGFLRSFDDELQIFSAGTKPASSVNLNAVKVMKEKRIDISGQSPNDVNEYTRESFDYVITVCDNARESCPVFTGKVKQRLHLGFEDPYEATGSEEEVLSVYRKVRDEIESGFRKFYDEIKKTV